MPLCAAVGCSNRREKGFLMKSFPRNKERRTIWAAQVNRAAWVPSDRSCLCQIHFESSMWLPGTTKLKPTAIPTLFLRQQKGHRSSSKKYFVDDPEENLNDEEETLVWISSPAVNHQDPLAITDETNAENNELQNTVETEPLILCKEELEVWTEDCVTGVQWIEKYNRLEKCYQASDQAEDTSGCIINNTDCCFSTNEEINTSEIESEIACSTAEERSMTQSSTHKNNKDILFYTDFERPKNNPLNVIYNEEIEVSTNSYCKPSNDEDDCREMLVTGM